MAPESGRKGSSVIDLLFAEAYRFDFFQAVHLLQRQAEVRAAEGDSKDRQHSVGYDRPPAREAVRFRAQQSLGFPAGPITRVEQSPPKEDGAPAPRPSEVTVSFFGLTGPSGVLPAHYTRLLLERMREKDRAAREFFDLFNHRAISLFYRAWEKYRFPITYERSKTSDSPARDDLFTNCLYSLVGLGLPSLRRRFEFDDEAVLYYAGLFAQEHPCAVSLERMLEDYFELPVQIQQFQGRWLYLDEDDRSQLPSRTHSDGINSQLGTSMVMGERIWDVQSKFRIRLGPCSYRQFQRFTPQGDSLKRLLQMVRLYSGSQFDFDVQPVLRGDEVPWFQFSRDPERAPRLGWNTWVRSRDFTRDIDDAVFFVDRV